MNIILRAINRLFHKPSDEDLKLAAYKQDLINILRQIDSLDAVCNESLMWPTCEHLKYDVYLCLNDLVLQRNIASRYLEYIEYKHRDMVDHGEYYIKRLRSQVKAIHATYKKVAARGPVITTPPPED
jgi:hypothetical protein